MPSFSLSVPCVLCPNRSKSTNSRTASVQNHQRAYQGGFPRCPSLAATSAGGARIATERSHLSKPRGVHGEGRDDGFSAVSRAHRTAARAPRPGRYPPDDDVRHQRSFQPALAPRGTPGAHAVNGQPGRELACSSSWPVWQDGTSRRRPYVEAAAAAPAPEGLPATPFRGHIFIVRGMSRLRAEGDDRPCDSRLRSASELDAFGCLMPACPAQASQPRIHRSNVEPPRDIGEPAMQRL